LQLIKKTVDLSQLCHGTCALSSKRTHWQLVCLSVCPSVTAEDRTWRTGKAPLIAHTCSSSTSGYGTFLPQRFPSTFPLVPVL